MNYKVLKGNELFDKLMALKNRLISVREEAQKFVESLGFEEYATSSGYSYIAGGVDAIHIPRDKEVPEGWKRVGQDWQRFFYPKVKGNKELLARFSALPRVKIEEATEIFNFEWGVDALPGGAGLSVTRCPAIEWGSDFVLVSSEGGKLPKHKDMIEILGSEFKRLQEQTDSAKEKKAKSKS